ncbi:hypothetical protein VTI74DRAFT_4400 [Chaetomium olivicolor]
MGCDGLRIAVVGVDEAKIQRVALACCMLFVSCCCAPLKVPLEVLGAPQEKCTADGRHQGRSLGEALGPKPNSNLGPGRARISLASLKGRYARYCSLYSPSRSSQKPFLWCPCVSGMGSTEERATADHRTMAGCCIAAFGSEPPDSQGGVKGWKR